MRRRLSSVERWLSRLALPVRACVHVLVGGRRKFRPLISRLVSGQFFVAANDQSKGNTASQVWEFVEHAPAAMRQAKGEFVSISTPEPRAILLGKDVAIKVQLGNAAWETALKLEMESDDPAPNRPWLRGVG